MKTCRKCGRELAGVTMAEWAAGEHRDDCTPPIPSGKPAAEPERPTIMIGELCYMHLRDLVVDQLHLKESDPWRAAVIATQILIFSRIMADPLVKRRTGGDVEKLNDLLADIGCIACLAGDIYSRAVKVAKKGLAHTAAVSRFEVEDPAFPNDRFGAIDDRLRPGGPDA